MEEKKEIKLRVGEVIKLYEAFKDVSDKEIPFDTALIIAENMEALKIPYNVAKKKRDSIIQSALELDENGNPILVGTDTYKTKPGMHPQEEIDSLMEEEVSLSDLKKFPLSDIKNITIKPSAITTLKAYTF